VRKPRTVAKTAGAPGSAVPVGRGHPRSLFAQQPGALAPVLKDKVMAKPKPPTTLAVKAAKEAAALGVATMGAGVGSENRRAEKLRSAAPPPCQTRSPALDSSGRFLVYAEESAKPRLTTGTKRSHSLLVLAQAHGAGEPSAAAQRSGKVLPDFNRDPGFDAERYVILRCWSAC